MTKDRFPARVREERRKSASERYAPVKGVEAIGVGATCIALGILLPLVFHAVGISPRVVLPMHFPVFLAGMLLPMPLAAAVGVMAPALSMGFTGMPTPDQAMRMVPELATYAVVTALILRLMPVWPFLSDKWGRISALVTAMLIAMLAGRCVYVLVSSLMIGLNEPSYYVMILVVPAIPGIIAQLILVPPLAYRVQQVIYRSESGSK